MRATRRDKQLARTLYRLCLVDGQVDETRARAVVTRVVGARRRGHLGVLSHFHRLVRLNRERHTAHVESAVPLPDDLRAGIASNLAGRLGRGVQASFTEDPSLIGGVRLRVGSDVYDGSVRARLQSIASGL
jgi:F-type H+-transporting ATPase subunit delta